VVVAYYGRVSAVSDSKWRSASSLIFDRPITPVATWRCWASPPTKLPSRRARQSVRRRDSRRPGALLDLVLVEPVDLGEYVAIVDHGDVADPDGDGGHERVAEALAAIEQPVTMISA